MTRKLNAHEPLLIAAARTLGKAAGTLVNMTQILTTEPTPPESHSPSKPESIKQEGSNKKSSATLRQDLPKKQSHAIPKKRTAKSRKASARNPIATKRGSGKKP